MLSTAAPVRLLDPTCGSGAFLVAALQRLRTAQGPNVALENLLQSVVGIDLHPLAVASARANYLLAVADLVGRYGDIELPVYCGDALPRDALPQKSSSLKSSRERLPPTDRLLRAGESMTVGRKVAGTLRVPSAQTGNESIIDWPVLTSVDRFDFVVGNPPWVAWDNLPQVSREATRSLWQQYGLFSLSGRDARHGGAKKDLSMLVLYACADRFLSAGGRLGMVITQTIFQSKGAGDGFRRFQLGPAGEPLGVLRVDDMTELRPFAGAANWTSTVVLEKGKPTVYPVQYVKWSPGAMADVAGGQPKRDDAPAEERYQQTIMQARPVDGDRLGSPWLIEAMDAILALADRVGGADYVGHLGANSGGANAVYWLELLGRAGRVVRVANRVAKAKTHASRVEAEIEPGLIYPLLRWTDVRRWSARPSAFLLMAQDPNTRNGIDEARMRREFPQTLAYLRQFESLLARRAAYRRYQERQPFYSMYNIGSYTIAAHKVVWRRMDRQIRAAVVGEIEVDGLGRRPVVPQETCVLVACSSAAEAHYLCALMNSRPVDRVVSAHSVAGGKGFGTPSVLDFLPLRKFSPGDDRHLALSSLSMAAHAAADAQESVAEIAAQIDAVAGNLL